MANMEDYIRWRGDLTFEQDPFNEVDSLVLSEIAYVNLRGIVPEFGSGEKITLEKASQAFFEINEEEKLKSSKSFIWYAPFLMRIAAISKRYRNIRLFDYHEAYNEDKQTQFGAFSADIGDGTIYVAFMGTDDSITGWREDFNMSFLVPVPAQEEAVKYVNEVTYEIMKHHPLKKLRIGGHSKGGNLAIYAAAKGNRHVKKRIVKIYNNDGPGFVKEFVEDSDFLQIRPLITSIVPYHSVVGMLLEHDEHCIVVKSSEKGIMQHDALSWQVMGNHFDTMRSVSAASRALNEALSNWINSIDRSQKIEFVDALFNLLMASGATTLSDVHDDRFNSASAAFKMYNSLDKDKKSMIKSILKSLSDEFDRTKIRAIIKQ